MDRVAEAVAKLATQLSGHTPPPWEWYGPTRGEGLTFTNEAHVGPGKGNESGGPIAAVSGDDKEHAVANAKLVAVAPDLLELVLYVRHIITQDAPLVKRIDAVLKRVGITLPAEQAQEEPNARS